MKTQGFLFPFFETVISKNAERTSANFERQYG